MAIRVSSKGWALSSRDIWRGASCPHCTDLAMAIATEDEAAKAKVDGHEPDLTKVLAIIQGTDFENMLVDQLRTNLKPNDLVELQDFPPVSETIASLNARPKVIAQARLEKTYGNVSLGGFADLLIRDDFEPGISPDGTFDLVPSGQEFSGYTVWDIKHSSEVQDNYLFQVGGYIEGLKELGGLSKHSKSGIIIRTKEAVGFESTELLEKFGGASSDLFAYLNANLPDTFSLRSGFVYECTSPKICVDVRCEYPGLCKQERYNRDDLSQLYRIHPTHPPKLIAAGFDTVTKISQADDIADIGEIKPEQFAKHKNWAKVITRSRQSGKPEIDLLVTVSEIRGLLPPKNEGDLFVDFEWYSPTGEADQLVYMFGVTDWDERFYPFVAESRDKEIEAFRNYVGFTLGRIKKYPSARLYHFNNPEVTVLNSLVKRYGVLAEEVAQIQERMFDLLDVVRDRMVTSLGGLGIKDLGKFFLSDHQVSAAAEGDSVSDGLDSMLFFYNYLRSVADGDEAESDELMKKILTYNKSDCTATSRLYTWLYDGKFS
jgi:predicted RecB family nuclease